MAGLFDTLSNIPKAVVYGLLIITLFPLICLNGWLILQILQYLQPFVSIFTISALLAFILNYPVHFLQQGGLNRGYAVLLVFLTAIATISIIGVILFPFLFNEINAVLERIPEWLDAINKNLSSLQAWSISQQWSISINETIAQLTDEVISELNSLGEQIFNITLLTLESLSQVALALVLTFYFLLDGQRIVNWLLELFPYHIGQNIGQSLQQNFQNYFLGQAIVATLASFLMTIAFYMLGVDFALLCGITVGAAALVPFADILVFSVISALIAIQDIWLGIRVIVVALVLDQTIDQAIAPRLVGKFIGLGPIEVISSLLLGAKLGGVVGLFIAIPFAGFFKSAFDSIQTWRSVLNDSFSTHSPDGQDGTEQSAPPPQPSVPQPD
ncbi:MAG TPA: AI-2E family transporter [Elainellaceae cyanobacterium]